MKTLFKAKLYYYYSNDSLKVKIVGVYGILLKFEYACEKLWDSSTVTN